uniref:Micro-fibrillar-associated protein 1 C-terminal domain-containing protein n=1 Tax=Strigamia maritima TaxID=126957 RepID=T1IK48_STRMM
MSIQSTAGAIPVSITDDVTGKQIISMQKVKVRRYVADTTDEEDEIKEKKRLLLRKKNLELEDILDFEDEEDEPEAESSESEYEENSESEEDDFRPILKPVFVSKKDRVTIQLKEKIELQQLEIKIKAKKMADDRRKESLRFIEDENKKDLQDEDEDEMDVADIDDENDKIEYESWKLRNLKRIKMDRNERVAAPSGRDEKDEIETEKKTKVVKGKYKFLQKYYHRGAFFMDEDEEVYKRDICQPTLEDHFDKSVLPKVMQVKNFGRSGQSKYTHLVDQDTTCFDSPWSNENSMNLKFGVKKAGGMKEILQRPKKKSK